MEGREREGEGGKGGEGEGRLGRRGKGDGKGGLGRGPDQVWEEIDAPGAAAAVVRPYGAWYKHSVPTHPSPQRSSPADRSAPLGRRVSGNGVLRAGCTK